jgi:hypothetical protein
MIGYRTKQPRHYETFKEALEAVTQLINGGAYAIAQDSHGYYLKRVRW